MKRAGKLLHLEDAFAAGYTGKGITAAILDTGIGATPYLTAERIRVFRDFVNLRHHPYDDAGHGTHVAGILAGNGTVAGSSFRGIAPECDLVILKGLNGKGDGELSGALAALKWVLEQRKRYDIRVLNLSFGATENDKIKYRHLIEMVERVWESGVCVVAAAGNRGPEKGTITVPGSSSRIITIGAAESGKLQYWYSGRGPTAEQVMKPDLVAPAAGIFSLKPLRREFMGTYAAGKERRNFFTVKSGTSMATPMAAGAACLLLQKEPELSPDEVKNRMWQSCVDLGLPPEQQGHGMLDLRLLLQL